MREARLLRTEEIPVHSISANNRLRPVSEDAVRAIVASITATGVMKDEIIVREVRHQDGAIRLIAGAHRLVAARHLGWEAIRAKVFDCSDDWARLMEIDDNLAHAELSPLELATFLAARKEVYLRAFPETAQGGDRRSASYRENQTELSSVWSGGSRQSHATELSSFASMIAEKRSMTDRQVRKYVAVGEALTPSTVAALQGARGLTLKTLTGLARIEGDEQVRVASEFCFRGAKTVDEALRRVREEPVPPQADPGDAAYARLMTAFERAPMVVRRRFLDTLRDSYPELMAGVEE